MATIIYTVELVSVFLLCREFRTVSFVKRFKIKLTLFRNLNLKETFDFTYQWFGFQNMHSGNTNYQMTG